MVSLTKKRKKLLSLIIPAYKQEKTIQKDIVSIKSVLDTLTNYSYEIIVVVDGMVDDTYINAKRVTSPFVRVLGYPHNHGKGFAVRYGMAQAKGDIVAFLDAGMDLDPSGIITLLGIMEEKDADIVIGSKVHPRSNVSYPFQRVILSYGYRFFVRTLFGLSVLDTQVGMKMFKKTVITKVLPRLLVKKYAFDIEILAVAYYLGYRKIYEAPVKLKFNNWSSITSKNFWRAILHMLWDTSAVFYRLKMLHYYADSNKKKWKYNVGLQYTVNSG